MATSIRATGIKSRRSEQRARPGFHLAEEIERRMLLSGIAFSAPRAYAVGEYPYAVATADFDGDGRLDLAVGRRGGVDVLRNLGGGTFIEPAVNYAVPGDVYAVTAVDVDGDGRADLVAGGGGGLGVLRNNGDGTFAARVDVAAGGVNSVAAADFDGDGRADLAVTSGGTVSVLRNTGGGSFGQPADYAVGSALTAATAADLNADGRPDVAVLDNGSSSATVDVLANTGNGGVLAAPVTYPAGLTANALTSADFDNDGRADLAVAGVASPTVGPRVGVLRNKGDGTFGAKTDYATPYAPYSIASADFSGDGRPDLAVAGYQGTTSAAVSVLRNGGTGTFVPAGDAAVGLNPNRVAAGDFDSDGRPDLAVTDLGTLGVGGSTVGILRNTGDGKLAARTEYATGPNPAAVTGADFDGDGDADLAVANRSDISSVGSVSILLNNGDGTFAAHVRYSTGRRPGSIVAADFDGDGRVDLSTGNAGSGGGAGVSILHNNGDGTFARAVDYAAAVPVTCVVAGDFDGDGRPDLALGLQGSGGVSVLLNRGDGTFAAGIHYAAPYGVNSVAAADLDGDGRTDLAVACDSDATGDGSLRVLRNNGDGTFTAAGADYATGPAPRSVTAADFDGDGRRDLAVANDNSRGRGGTVSLLRNNGDGTFAPKVDYPVGLHAGSVVSADVDGDGRPDLVVASQNSSGTTYRTGTLSLLRNNGNGTFARKADYLSGVGATAVTAADFDGDGRPDLAVTDYSNSSSVGTLGVLRNLTGPIPLALPDTFSATPRVLSLGFSKDVGASIGATDVLITPASRGTPISPASVSFDTRTNTARFVFSTPLPDGNYRATIANTDVGDSDGNPLPGDFAADFFVLAGDANRDRVVNFNDLLIVASNYNKTGATYVQGDFTGDGVVNFNDLLILAGAYNKALPAVAPAPVLALSSEPATGSVQLRGVLTEEKSTVFSGRRISQPQRPTLAPRKSPRR